MPVVADVMTTNPAVCTPEDMVIDAAQKMAHGDFGFVPVVDSRPESRVIGVLTDRDIVVRCVAPGKNISLCRVGDCMTTRAQVISPDAPLEECYHLMQRLKVRRVPVVDSSQKLVGVVSMADLADEVDDCQLGQTLAEVLEQDTRQLYSEVQEENVTGHTVTPVDDPATDHSVRGEGVRKAS